MAQAAQLDFTNVKDGGNFNKRHQEEGDYRGKILKVADVNKKDDKSVKMWLWTIKVGAGIYPYYTTHTGEGAENQMWKIRNLFIAAGKNVPKKRLKVNPDDIVGRDIGVTLGDEEYEGKMQSVITATFPTSELEGSEALVSDDDGEEGEEVVDDGASADEAPPAKKEKHKDKAGKDKKKAAPEPEPEPEPKKGKDKAKDKKGKEKKKGGDKELEELDIEDI